MESRAQSRDRERPHPSPNFLRTSSRSSTSTSATRVTPRSANSSTSHLISSPRSPNGHPSHKYHHASCAPSATSRPVSVLSRDIASESGRQSAASSYLQEKLQKSREEAERLAAIQSTPKMSPSMEFPPRSQSSSTKHGSVDGLRPMSSGTSDSAKKRGMGLKEMEASVSTLHKQNFDLKLELFHRRERQSVLEERIEALETEKAQIDNVNDKLLDELDKRDKAVQEAVQMIVALEAQVETMMKEREMVRRVDVAAYSPADEPESRLNGPTPKPKMADLARLEEDAKTLTRMPSFMSDRTENTENLRRVYLNSHGSPLSLPRIKTEDTDGYESPRIDSLASPSLSVLSESSFVSVYGERDQDHTIVADDASMMDGTSPHSRPRKLSMASDNVEPQKPIAAAPVRPDRPSRASSITRTPGPGQFQSIQDIIGQTSPLQQLARLEHSYLDRSPIQEQLSFAKRGQTHQYVKDAKQGTLRRVVTDGPVTRSSDQVFPPTPDTMSTSTLRRFKNSDDNLDRHRNVSGQTSQSFGSGRRTDEAEHTRSASVFQQPLVSAFGNGPISSAFDTRPPLIPRPRSADESTISHHREPDWGSDTESVHSLDSSLDIWLQQGKDPKGFEQSRSGSPDLFNFPPSGAGWTPGMFESAAAPFGLCQPVINPVDLMAAQEALFPDAVHPPPAPNRRSSLGAKTGPTSRHSPINGKLRRDPSRSSSRQSSVDTHMLQLADAVAQASPSTEPKSGSRSKDSHYPPSSGAAPRGHRLNFFRRSVGGGPTGALPELAPPAEETGHAIHPAPMGMPSWVQRGNMIDEDRASATPPPIMRNPRPHRAVSVDHGAPVVDRTPMTPTTPVDHRASLTPVAKGTSSCETTPTSNSVSGGAPLHKRKWLPGFGRTSSLRNRAG